MIKGKNYNENKIKTNNDFVSSIFVSLPSILDFRFFWQKRTGIAVQLAI